MVFIPLPFHRLCNKLSSGSLTGYILIESWHHNSHLVTSVK
jgi:hypothetical protein